MFLGGEHFLHIFCFNAKDLQQHKQLAIDYFPCTHILDLA